MVPLALDASATSGHVVAAAVLIGLLTLQAYLLRSPTVNRPGAWSVALVYAALLLFQLNLLATRQLGASSEVVALVQVSCFLLLFVALTLGIVGAVQVHAARRAGRAVRSGGAGWGIGLSAIVLVSFVGGLVAAAVSAATGPAHGSPWVRRSPSLGAAAAAV